MKPYRKSPAFHPNLQRSFARLDAAGVDGVARALLAARKVWVLGLRSSQAFASYFRWQMFQIKEDIQLVPHAGDTLGQTLASVTPRDVVVVFAVRRRPVALAALLTQLVQAGHRVLYISDEQVPRQSGLTWHLYCACESDSPLDDHVAVTGVCHLLASRVLELAGPAERARMTAIEASHDALQEL